MIRVSVIFHLTLARYSPNGARSEVIELAPGHDLGALLGQLGIPPTLGAVVLVNGRRAGSGVILQDQDRVDLMLPLTGG
ncbi:MAG: MoaD/ThiS family protein [Bacillota bacterium]